MSKVLVDIEYFKVNSWLIKSQCERYLIQTKQSKQTLIECQNNLRSQNKKNNDNLIYQLGIREFMLGNFKQSLIHYQKYLENNPNCQYTQIQIAQLQYRLGNILDAEQKALLYLNAHHAAVIAVGNAGGLDENIDADDLLDEYNLLVLYSLMVQIQYAKNNQKILIDYISKILEINNNDTFALIYLADFLMNYPDKREYAIAQLKILRQRVYNERIDFTQQTFQDLVNIIEKYNDIILRE